MASQLEPFSEDAILALINQRFRNTHPEAVLGRGDDCTIFRKGGQICASSDLFLENVHFRCSYFGPQDIGYKALAVNISDLAAMGAKPFAFTLALGLPAWVNRNWIGQFLDGMAPLTEEEGMLLAGGDISRSDCLHISITVFGRCLPERSFLLRGGNMPGDILFIIGSLGLARVGLCELEAQGRDALPEWPDACGAHLRPRPQTSAGLMLARAAYNARPPTLMDVSDGLARDLRRLLGNDGVSTGLGAQITLSDDMLPGEVLRHAELRGEEPAFQAFLGGEDYALLGACAPDMASILHAAIPGFRAIGEITGPGPIYCNGRNTASIHGYDHFANH